MSTLIFSKELPFGTFQTWDGTPPYDVFHVHQVHGVEFACENEQIKADGICGKQTIAWAIKTADCMPVVLASNSGAIFLHAGWRGLADKIHLKPQVKALKPTYAFIGPHIGAKAFEVGEDFHQHFPNSKNFILHANGHKTFDLAAQMTMELKEAYTGIEVEVAPLCTFTDERLHSYRRNKTTQRNWNLFTSNEFKNYNES